MDSALLTIMVHLGLIPHSSSSEKRANTKRRMPKPARDLVSEETSSSMSATTAANNWWVSAKLIAEAAAAKTRVAAGTAKLRAEVALIDREINGRKNSLGWKCTIT